MFLCQLCLSDVFRLKRAGAGLPVCIVREALWAQHGGCDRVLARLQRIIATVKYPLGFMGHRVFVYTTN